MRIRTPAIVGLLAAAFLPISPAQNPNRAAQPVQLPAGVQSELDIAYADESPAQKLDLYLPPGKANAPRPAIVVVHGGGWRGGDKQRGQWVGVPAQYASDGYVALSVNYRLTGEAPWPAQIEDVKAAVRWLRAHAKKYGVDVDRIGAYGNSAGAHLVSSSATPTDFLNWREPGAVPERLGRTFLAGPSDTLRARARQASPITYARGDAPPFLLIHGTADRTVPISQSGRFAKALREAGAKQVRYMIFDNETHGVFQRQRLLTYPAMKAFFADALAQ